MTFSNLPTKRIQSCDVTADDQRVNIVCTFVSSDAFKVHEMPNHRVTICDACSAKYVACFARALQLHPDIVALGLRNLCRTRCACLHQARETKRQQLRRGKL